MEYDKLSVVMVCLNTETETEDTFLQMMNTLFDTERPEKEKKDRLEKEYEIKMENGLGEELSFMCNLSDAVEERGIKKGIEQGKLEMLISLVRDHVLSTKDAANRAEISDEEFVKLIEKKEKMK